MISTVTNRGRLAFMIYKVGFTAAAFFRFLRRLVRQNPRLIYLIVDGHPEHRFRAVMRWQQEYESRIRLYRLPAYSPKLNPDELLNQDVKCDALGRRRPADVVEMVVTLRSYLRNPQKRPEIVRSYFCEKHVRYAA